MSKVALFVFHTSINFHSLEREVLLSRVSQFCMYCYAGMSRLIYVEAVARCN